MLVVPVSAVAVAIPVPVPVSITPMLATMRLVARHISVSCQVYGRWLICGCTSFAADALWHASEKHNDSVK